MNAASADEDGIGGLDTSRSDFRGQSILMLTKYPVRGASSRMRALQYAPFFEMAGAAVTVAPLFSDRYLAALYSRGARPAPIVIASYARRLFRLLSVRKFDLIWLEKEAFPYLPSAFEEVLVAAGVPYVLDYDDAVFHNYDLSPSPLTRGLLKNKLDRLLKGAALVTVGNDYLDDYVTAHGARQTLLLPTVVDVDRYRVSPAPGGDTLRIGWIGTPSTTPHLKLIWPALSTLSSLRSVRLVTVGAPPLEERNFPLEQHSWSQRTETERLEDIDVGVMPLPDEPFERGKCAYKLIQYMASARPVVASPVSVNAQVVTPDVGFLATSNQEWVSALLRLADDPALRSRLGLAGRGRVEETFSLQVQAPRLLETIAHIIR
jgi:glycosyltransferase involved in cell wall biosynthesis